METEYLEQQDHITGNIDNTFLNFPTSYKPPKRSFSAGDISHAERATLSKDHG